MANLTSFDENTHKNLQLDAGIFIANLEVEEFLKSGELKEGDEATHILLGATKGGASFTASPEVRSLFDGIDGARGVYKNGQIIDTWDITLKTSLAEMTAANLGYVIANSTIKLPSVEPLVKKYHELGANVGMVAENLYLNNVCWLGSVVGSKKPLLIELKNVLNTNGVNLTSEDKGTGAIECEFKAHFDLKTPNNVPYAIYTPSDLEPTPQKVDLIKK